MISQDYFMVAKQFEILQFFVVIDLMQMDKQRECLYQFQIKYSPMLLVSFFLFIFGL